MSNQVMVNIIRRIPFTLAWFNEIIVQQILNFFPKIIFVLCCSFNIHVVLQAVNPQDSHRDRFCQFL